MGYTRQQLGMWGEGIAAAYLEDKGLQIIDRNVRTGYGEIDLIARISGVTVFVEVKTRSGLSFGLPEESVTESKALRLQEASEAFMQSHPQLEGDWRIDVIAILGDPDDLYPEIVWFENAIA